MEESRGEGVLDRSVGSQQHRVRRTFGPAQYYSYYYYYYIYIYIYVFVYVFICLLIYICSFISVFI